LRPGRSGSPQSCPWARDLLPDFVPFQFRSTPSAGTTPSAPASNETGCVPAPLFFSQRRRAPLQAAPGSQIRCSPDQKN
jgi:hypothetical protein